MLCSKCKLKSIHLNSFERTICALGHLICANCQSNDLFKCPVCGDKIEKKIKLVANGVPKLVFLAHDDDVETEQGSESTISSDRRSEYTDSDSSKIQSDLLIGSQNDGIFTILDPEGFIQTTDDEFSSSDHMWEKYFEKYNPDINELYSERSLLIKESKSSPSITASKKVELFRNSSHENIIGTKDNNIKKKNKKNIMDDDPRQLFVKKISGSLPNDFSPRNHYYKTMAELKTFRDLMLQNSNLDIKINKSIDNCSNKLNNSIESERKKEIKKKLTEQDVKLYIENMQEFRRETNYKQTKNLNVYKSVKGKTNTIIVTSNSSSAIALNEDSIENQIHNYHFNKLKNINKNTETFQKSTKISTLHDELREKLKCEVFSQFQQNNKSGVPIKCYPNHKVESPPEDAQNKSRIPVQSTPLKNLAPNVFYSTQNDNKRLEILQKEKETIRQKLREQIYSQFNEEESFNRQESFTKTIASEKSSDTSILLSELPKSTCVSTESYPRLNPSLSYVPSKHHQGNSNINDSNLNNNNVALSNNSNLDISNINKYIELQNNSQSLPSNLFYIIEENSEENDQKVDENFNQILTEKNDEIFIENADENIKTKSENNFYAINSVDYISHSEMKDEKHNQRVPGFYPSEFNPELYFYTYEPNLLKYNTPIVCNNPEIQKKLSTEIINNDQGLLTNLKNYFSEKNSLTILQESNANESLESVKIVTSKDGVENTTSPKSSFESHISNISNITAFRANISASSTKDHPIPQSLPINSGISSRSSASSSPDNIPYIKTVFELNIDRNPITCPITSCNKLFFISDFSKHIKIDHSKIPNETLEPGKYRNFFLDPRIDRIGMNKCHMLYLVNDKIKGLGYNKQLRDFLPIMVMSSRVSAQFIDPLIKENNSNFLMVWVTGICTKENPIYCSLTTWSKYDNLPDCHLVHSGKLYSIRNNQDHLSLYNSGQVMLISEEHCNILSDYGKNMIELQIVVH